MTKSEAKAAFMAKEIQIYTDCPNFSLLNEIIYRGEKETKFTESTHINKYFLKDGAGYEYKHTKHANEEYPMSPEQFIPIVKLSEITEDKKEATIETKTLTFELTLTGDSMCLSKRTKGFSTLELMGAYEALLDTINREKVDLMNCGREEVTNN